MIQADRVVLAVDKVSPPYENNGQTIDLIILPQNTVIEECLCEKNKVVIIDGGLQLFNINVTISAIEYFVFKIR